MREWMLEIVGISFILEYPLLFCLSGAMLLYSVLVVSQTKEAIMSNKNSRKHLSRLNRSSFDPDTAVRASKDLRSTQRPHDDHRKERPAGNRGLMDENKS